MLDAQSRNKLRHSAALRGVLLFSLSRARMILPTKHLGEVNMRTSALKPVVATAALALLGLVSAAALPARAQSADAIYAAAKTEGAFVLYVGGPTAPWEAS